MRSKNLIENIKILLDDLIYYLIEILIFSKNWVSNIIRNLNSGELRRYISKISTEIRSFIHDGTNDTDKEKLELIAQHNELTRLELELNEISKDSLLSKDEKEKFRERAEFIYNLCVKLNRIRKDREYELESTK